MTGHGHGHGVGEGASGSEIGPHDRLGRQPHRLAAGTRTRTSPGQELGRLRDKESTTRPLTSSAVGPVQVLDAERFVQSGVKRCRATHHDVCRVLRAERCIMMYVECFVQSGVERRVPACISLHLSACIALHASTCIMMHHAGSRA